MPEDIYLGKLPKYFWDARRENNMDQLTKTYKTNKNNNWREKNYELKSLKAAATKTETKLKEVDDYKSVFSDITFTVVTDPDIVQSHSASATTSIAEDPTIKVIFSAVGNQIKVPAAVTPGAINIIRIEVTKSQVAMLRKKGDTIS